MRDAAFFACGFIAAAVVATVIDRLLNPEPRAEAPSVVPAPFYLVPDGGESLMVTETCFCGARLVADFPGMWSASWESAAAVEFRRDHAACRKAWALKAEAATEAARDATAEVRS